MKPTHPLVIIESPYAGRGDTTTSEHVDYARDAMLDCLNRGEAPYASHLLYTQVLDDADPLDRALGLHSGWAWMQVAHKVVVYVDYGMSQGMNEGIRLAQRLNKPIEYRSLHGKATA